MTRPDAIPAPGATHKTASEHELDQLKRGVLFMIAQLGQSLDAVLSQSAKELYDTGTVSPGTRKAQDDVTARFAEHAAYAAAHGWPWRDVVPTRLVEALDHVLSDAVQEAH